MIERLAALPRGLDRHPQALDGRALADILVELLGTQLTLELRLLRQRHPAHDPRFVGHETLFAPR